MSSQVAGDRSTMGDGTRFEARRSNANAREFDARDVARTRGGGGLRGEKIERANSRARGMSGVPCASCGKYEIKLEPALGCEICQACGAVHTASVLQTTLNWTEDGAADGTFLQDGAHVGAHLAAARAQMVSMPGASHVTRNMFRDRESTNLYHISKSVEHTGAQLKLSKDIIAEVKELVTRASDGKWGQGQWTSQLTGACVYSVCRQNNLPVAMREVAEACSVNVFTLGRVFHKLQELHGLKMPPLDPENYVARAVAALPELAAISNKNSSVQPARGSTTRSVMIAPTVRDAKVLLKFAFSRGLLIGRDPIVIVAAVVIVVARLHGVKVSVERAAQASRVQSVSVRKRLKELLGEIISFAQKFPWGEEMCMKRLDDYLPIAFKFIATAESSKEMQKTSIEAPPPVSVVDGLPPAFRTANDERSKVLQSIQLVRNHSVASDKDAKRLASVNEDEDEQEDLTETPTTSSAPVRPTAPVILAKPLEPTPKRKRVSRGGVRRQRTVIKQEPKTEDEEDAGEEPKLPFGLAEDKDLGWQEVMLHGLLLAGVPERLLSTEMKPLDPTNRESVFDAGEVFSKAMAERSVDPLLKETNQEIIERQDALAIDAIDDEELDYMFRSHEEMEVVRLLRQHEEQYA